MNVYSKHYQVSIHLGSKSVDLQVWSINVDTVRVMSGEIVEILERMSVDIFCVKEARYMGEKVWIINGSAAQYKLFWIEDQYNGLRGVGISWQRNGYLKLLTVKLNDRMVVIKEFVQGIIISMISVHALYYGLDDNQKHTFLWYYY